MAVLAVREGKSTLALSTGLWDLWNTIYMFHVEEGTELCADLRQKARPSLTVNQLLGTHML